MPYKTNITKKNPLSNLTEDPNNDYSILETQTRKPETLSLEQPL